MIRSLFATRLYQELISDETLLGELAHSIRSLAEDDAAGRHWSRDKGYKGYTSYASLNDLPKRDPAFAELQVQLVRHAVTLAGELAFDLTRKPKLDSIWVNLLKPGGHHAGHIHPHSILSGTLYVDVPDGSGSIRFEDPRLAQMMAAPLRRDDAAEDLRPFVTVAPANGLLLMWESWLRHEVLPGTAKADRLSISFNFA
jgi:uncharacterized protein (TIGR02466 family)